MAPEKRDDFRTAIVCALQREADAVETQLNEVYKSQDFGVADGDPNTYTLGKLGGHDIVLVWMPSEGNSLSSGAAASMMASFPRVNLVLLVGICAGVPSYTKDERYNEIILGDVIISTAVIQYDHGRQFPDSFQKKETLSQAPIAVRSRINQISGKRMVRNITESISNHLTVLVTSDPDYAYPGRLQDKLFQADYVHKHQDALSSCDTCREHRNSTDPVCDKARTATCHELGCDEQHLVKRRRLLPAGDFPRPAVHFGKIASGNVVMKSGEYRDKHAKEAGVIAFEMEAAGIWSRLPCIVIKGVCDYADSHKNKKFQDYASGTAAICARAILEELPTISTGEQQPNESKKRKYQFDTDHDMTLSLLSKIYVTDPRSDKARLTRSKGNVLKRSVSWLLHDRIFLHWKDSRTSEILWIKGDPGKGKTMLSLSLIDELSTHLHNVEGPANLAYFLCQSSDDRINNSTSVLRGLLWLLIEQDNRLGRHLRKRFDLVGQAIFEGPNSFNELWTVLDDIFNDATYQTTTLIVDAVDECDQGNPDELLRCIHSTSHKSPQKVKWLLTTRNNINVDQYLLHAGLKGSKSGCVISLEAESTKVSQAVSGFVESEVEKLAQLKSYTPTLKQQVQSSLESKAEGTFLWVSLVCSRLQQVPYWQTISILDKFPPGLSPLYDRMLDIIDEFGDKDTANFCRAILRTVVITHRSLHPKELGRLAGLPEDVCDTIESLRDLIGRCGSFLTIKDTNNVTFIHQSAKDYLKLVSEQRLNSPPDYLEYWNIAGRCMDVMAETLTCNMGGFSSLGSHISEKKDDVAYGKIIAQCGYSVCFWTGHLRQAALGHSNFTFPDATRVEHFLHKFCVHWFELLVLLDCTSSTTSMLDDLILLSDVTDQKGNATMRGFLGEVKQFWLNFAQVFASWPLQIYALALSFSPIRNLVKPSDKDLLGWIKVTRTDTQSCDSQHRLIEGHTTAISAMSLSPDGELIASGSVDGNVRICHADTGILKLVIPLSHGITSVAFSRDGKLLATASVDMEIGIWDISTGKQLQILHGHSMRINAMAFSPTEDVLASASSDDTIQLWNTENGSSLGVLQGHEDNVTSVAFHPNGYTIASASRDKSVRKWNVENKSPQGQPHRHRAEVLSVAFSADGNILACVQGFRVVLMCNLTGSIIKTLKFPLNTAFAFSPNRKLIASAYLTGSPTIKIWDTETGALRGTFLGHRGKITSVAFSPDSKSIVSASWDRTIRVWNAEQELPHSHLRKNAGSLATIAFSPNGRLVASAFAEKEATLWDAESGAELCRSVAESSGLIWQVSFSQDGQSLLTNQGSISLERVSEYCDSRPDVEARVDIQDEWAYWQGQKTVWLPPEYRPLTFAVRGDAVALACRSRQIVIMTFDPERTMSLLHRLSAQSERS